MNNMDLLKRCPWVKRYLWALLTITLIIHWCPSQGRADSNAITPSDIKYSDPFEHTASIMEIDYEKNRLIIAENEIYVVDLIIGAEHIKTELSRVGGEAILFDSLGRGQTIMVSGMKLPDGRVIAEALILITSGIENRRETGQRQLRNRRRVHGIKPAN